MALLENRVRTYNKKSKSVILGYSYYLVSGVTSVALLSLLIFLVFRLSFVSINSTLVDFNGSFYSSVITPAQTFFKRTFSLFVNAVNFDRLHVENIALRLENQKLLNKISKSNEIKLENKKLKEVNNIAEFEKNDSLKASIIYESSAEHDNLAVIAAGKKHGINKNFIVLSNGSLAGRIVTVDEKYSKVSLISSYNSRISVKTLNTGLKAILVSSADKKGFLIHLQTGQQKPREGELIVTSGDASFYPKDIPVARVESVKGNNVVVTLLSDLSSTDFVEVIDPNQFYN